MHGVGFWLLAAFVCLGLSCAFFVFHRLSSRIFSGRLARFLSASTAVLVGAPVGFFVGGNVGVFVSLAPLQHMGLPPAVGMPVMIMICVAAATLIPGLPTMLLFWAAATVARRIRGRSSPFHP